MIELRPYQAQIEQNAFSAWSQGAKNVLVQLSTGGGKTAILSHVAAQWSAPVAIMAHRNELVSQLSLALGKCGLTHDLIASDQTKSIVSKLHVAEFGRLFFQPGNPRKVVSVDTLIRRDVAQWASTVQLFVPDEAHHVLANNKWGKAAAAFSHPQCRGLFPTATPRRQDGKGLGRGSDGLADAMVLGPSAAWLMDRGYLCRYKVAAVDSHIEQFLGDVGASGDWSQATLKAASQQSAIVGDVVKSYQRFAPGKIGVTFVTDVETAAKVANAYNAAGIPAAVLTGETHPIVRRDLIRKLETRELLQTVAIDVISEGFDLPVIEVVTMARATASLAVFLQQFGRGMRPAPGKEFFQLIDHVGNFLRHGGGPDSPREWSLAARDKRATQAETKIRLCTNPECGQPFEAFRKTCPHCGTPVPSAPTRRDGPEWVDGDLSELHPDVLARLRGEVDRVDVGLEDYRQELIRKHAPHVGVLAGVKRHSERQQSQEILRVMMAYYGGAARAAGLTDAEIQRKFYLEYGLTVLEAQALGASEAAALAGRLRV